MSYVPPEPNAPPPQPQESWPYAAGPVWSGEPQRAARRKGPWLAVAAVVLGLLGCGLPLLPVAMDGFRHYLPIPFGIAGLVLASIAFTGGRRGLPVAIAGAMISVLALVLGTVTLSGH